MQSDKVGADVTTKHTLQNSIQRIAKTFTIGAVVAASLLSFPSVLPWIIAFWIGWHTLLVIRCQPGWVPLVSCLAIMLVKLAPRFPMIILLGVALGVVAFTRARIPREQLPMNRRRGLMSTAIIWSIWVATCIQWSAASTCRQPIALDLNRPIVCLGDSLTEGLLPDRGYPDQLKTMLSVPVINLGFSGISTSQGLGQLDRALSHRPQVLVIELGGHDFLKGHSRASTKANLVEMIKTCRARNTEIVLMEIPRGFMLDPFAAVEREIAYEHDVQLISDSWLRQIVLMSPIAPPGMWLPQWQLSDDGIHSNPRGSRAIAERVANALHAMYGDQILSES